MWTEQGRKENVQLNIICKEDRVCARKPNDIRDVTEGATATKAIRVAPNIDASMTVLLTIAASLQTIRAVAFPCFKSFK
jgi:hypothetical protein